MTDRPYGLTTLPDIFDRGGRRFRIPPYQRSYSWGTDQRLDLLADLENIAFQDFPHFTGTIVAVPGERDDVLDVVDGQQRLTTLVILVAELMRCPELEGFRYGPGRELDPLTTFVVSGREAGRSVYRLELNAETQTYFTQHILEGRPINLPEHTKAHDNLRDARDEFREWIQSKPHDLLGPQKILEAIIERLGFLFFVPARREEAGIMFEVINNRGKPLSELEKVKNYLVYYGTRWNKSDLVEEVNRSWGQILSRLHDASWTSNDEEDTYLRNSWIVFKDYRKTESYYVYRNMKGAWLPEQDDSWAEMLNLVRFLGGTSETLASLFSPRRRVTGQEARILELLSLQATNASILPLILAVCARVQDPTARVGLLELIECLNFRIYGAHIAKRSDAGQAELFWIAHRFYRFYEQPDPDDGTVWNAVTLKERLRAIIGRDAPDREFVRALTLDADEGFDYYTWSSLKYFLANYEHHLRQKGGQTFDIARALAPQDKKNPNDFFHVEHVWARKDHTIEAPNDYHKRRLAKFVLLEPSINIRVSNNPVEMKLQDYDSINCDTVPMATMLRELRPWYDEACTEEQEALQWMRRTNRYWLRVLARFLDKREKMLVKFALERWRTDYPGRKVIDVAIDSLRDGNEIFRLRYDRESQLA